MTGGGPMAGILARRRDAVAAGCKSERRGGGAAVLRKLSEPYSGATSSEVYPRSIRLPNAFVESALQVGR